MDDLAKKLNDLLNSPDGMQKIQEAASSLGILTGNGSGDSRDIFGNGEKSNPSVSEPSVNFPSSVPPVDGNLLGDMEMIKKLMPLLSNMRSDDQNTILLKALRPYLQDDRQQRLDESIKILQLLKVLPLLKDKDIL